jgi:endonuclease YncB( thermonuclease family)
MPVGANPQDLGAIWRLCRIGKHSPTGQSSDPDLMKISQKLIALSIPLGGLALAGCGGLPPARSPSSATRRGAHETAVVGHVVDGDTLDVWMGNREVRVRTLQIDAPESSTLRFGHADRCGAPAKAYAERLVHPGERVTLELAGSERHDRYGRLLALVHLGGPDALTWQQRMTRSGWAEVFVYRSNRTWLLPALKADQAYAKRHRLGVYELCKGEFHEKE